jgi:hypothetical protein
MNEDWEEEYSSPMQAVAISMHEMYVTLRKAGFSRRDGIELIAKMLITGISEASEQSDEEDE